MSKAHIMREARVGGRVGPGMPPLPTRPVCSALPPHRPSRPWRCGRVPSADSRTYSAQARRVARRSVA